MYNKIILPLDGSSKAEAALEEVKKLAADNISCEVILVYVVQPLRDLSPEPLFESVQLDIENSLTDWARKYLINATNDLQRWGIKATYAILRGYPSDKIVEYAAEKHVDLIVMATRGRTGPIRWIQGSVSERVSRLATCPVMIVQPVANAVTV